MTATVFVSGNVIGGERVGTRLTVKVTVVGNGGWEVRGGAFSAAGAELARFSKQRLTPHKQQQRKEAEEP